MRDDAVGGRAFGRRHLPFIGRGLDQHHAGDRAALAHIILRCADAAAAAGREIAPHALARHALARRRIFGGDLRPVAFELFGDQLGQPGQRALAHFRARDPDDDGVVGLDHDPGVDFRRAVGGARDRGATSPPAPPQRCCTSALDHASSIGHDGDSPSDPSGKSICSSQPASPENIGWTTTS